MYTNLFLPPATKLAQGNIFRSVCQEFCSHPELGDTGNNRAVHIILECILGYMFHSYEDRLHIEIYRQLVHMSHVYMVVIYRCCHPSGKNIFQGQQILPISAIFEPTKNCNPRLSVELAEDNDHLNKTRDSFIKYNATRNISLLPTNKVWGKVMFSQVSVILSTRGSISRGVCIGGWADSPSRIVYYGI